jgi:hypothetical protein
VTSPALTATAPRSLDDAALHRLPPPPRALRPARPAGQLQLWLGRVFLVPHGLAGLGVLALLGWKLSAAFGPGPGVDWKAVAFLTVFAAVWNGFLAFLLWQVWVVPRRLARLYREGEAVRGTVLEARELRSSSGTRRLVRFRFVTPRGEAVEREAPLLGPERWELPRPGQALTVLFDPSAPARHPVVYELGPWRVEGA